VINGQFVLEVVGKLTDEERKTLQYLLSDALHDFRARRKCGNARAYVQERYSPEVYSPGSGRFEEKVKQVQARLVLAEKLHNAAVSVTIREVNPSP
jgi:hypothetical protein